jgi:hypothetical protein
VRKVALYVSTAAANRRLVKDKMATVRNKLKVWNVEKEVKVI